MLLRSLILTGAINGLFFILLLSTKDKRSGADKLLSCWMALLACQLFFYYDSLSQRPVLPFYIQFPAFLIPLISSCLLYFYIKWLAFGEEFRFKKQSIHFLPYVALNLVCFWLYITTKGAIYLADGFPHFGIGVKKLWMYTIPAMLAIVPGAYSIAGLFVLLKYQKSLPDNYSYTEKINLNWLKWMVIVLLFLFFVLFLLIRYGVGLRWVNYENLFALVGAILTGYVFFIGYSGFRQQTFTGDISLEGVTAEDSSTLPGYRNSGLTETRVEELFLHLKMHMDNQKPFLTDTLSLSMLAAQLNINANQLSQVINQKTNSNFFTFINQYRVAAVKEKLSDPALAHYSILGIAYECGFGSKSSFNKIFKELAGMTPFQYQKISAAK